jgi:hypothetical protein
MKAPQLLVSSFVVALIGCFSQPKERGGTASEKEVLPAPTGTVANGTDNQSDRSSCVPDRNQPGITTCCGVGEPKLCLGACYNANNTMYSQCACGDTIGGCIAPEACCRGVCRNPLVGGDCSPAPVVNGAPDRPQGPQEGSGPLPSARPVPTYTVVRQSLESCGLVKDLSNIDATIQTCCNGKICNGQCVLHDQAREPVCECAGFVDGCPSPHVCCSTVQGCTNRDACKYTQQ